MTRFGSVLVFVALQVLISEGVPRPAPVSNEDIRKAILQLVNVMTSTESKLERHEARERQWGDSLKKSIVIVDKRLKMIEPLKGAFNRLDERLAAVESILLQKDEQLQKTANAVEDIHKNLPIFLEKMTHDIIEKITSQEPPAQITEPSVSKKDFEKLEKELVAKVDKVSKTIDGMQREIVKIRDENNAIHDLNNKSSDNLDKVKRQLDSGEQMLQRYESKLAEYNNKIPLLTAPNPKEDEWHNKLVEELQQHSESIKQIQANVQQMDLKLRQMPEKKDLLETEQKTINTIDGTIKSLIKPQKTDANLTEALQDLRQELLRNHQEINATLGDIYDMSTGLAAGIPTSYDEIKQEIQALGKLEQVIMQTADSVLDTKKRVEFGVHQIVGDLGNKLKDSTKKTIEALNERFDAFDVNVLDGDSGALANFTNKISEEIDKVWRQIGIMHVQMTTSTDTLNKLQNQTDVYVTGSLQSMDSMKGKVGQITGRITEVDDDLNYLLGRLSLVTQEFNQIRAGLGKALEEIKTSFNEVQTKLKDAKDAGPGPHNITSNEVAGN